jgi:hypothetical protein
MKFGDFGGISNPAVSSEITSNPNTYNTYQSPSIDSYSTTNYNSYTSTTLLSTDPISDNSKYSTDFFLE